jgi:hypothetical protein
MHVLGKKPEKAAGRSSCTVGSFGSVARRGGVHGYAYETENKSVGIKLKISRFGE